MFGLFLLLSLAGLVLTLWAQAKVRGNYSKWSKVPARSGLTGAEVARRILDQNGLYNVAVEPVRGMLTDHYDPVSRVVRLSEGVYSSSSIAAISVAAHECGHAIQHKEAYGALVLRHRMVPVLNITSGLAPFLLMAGIFFKMTGMLLLGLIFFSVAVLFHLVTLPVEFNASSRAKTIMVREGFINGASEERGVRKVLGAAALTYVAGAVVALVELLQYVALFFLQQDD
ncbi:MULTISPECIES: zinc metallopeptidase [Thermoactinomyces]|uniref:Zinc metallopeptidase n=2 Tax=Thermoactinomyces TaxID=2023 RepID=A0ABS0QI35_THEVU|nr:MULTISPECIES: zinc metallopeptidase [Thermoactinomyces]KYQ86873.1 peptidase [Thermoactinomyces sp. AS95]MBA4551766.1 zinc metallopeptidase [Thermoactinomyces vulgaris]MBA4596355.1 zinc metallopeptidase [Thermoactinomyces vulgaris]MBH8582914.1 zinc metallopeptidase [Thermoactinomyces sp. CICC 10735]MBH8585704.1 zinc metallopeptidase [Thermoactinomyces sp. CICC 10520]